MIQPVERGRKYALAFASTLFEVDPRVGGRITTFALDGDNVIADETMTGDPINWGSTSWPSPQANWGVTNHWPPIARIDSDPYSGAVDRDAIVLTSAPSPATSAEAMVRFTKRFSVDSSAQAINIALEIKNEGPPTSWAPWQVTRVAADGLSFFPTGTVVVSNTLATTQSLGVTWYQHPDGLPLPDSTISGAKLTAHAASPWLAHVSGALVFVQTFPAVDPVNFAPAEGEVEIYAANSKRYVEVEAQGPYTKLATGASLSWNLRWYLRRLPTTVKVEAGNAELVEFVNELTA